MPIVDIPLEKLKEYNGINPCPPDFDKFWDDSLQEMTYNKRPS
jgi:cephalosporin-C deacetylase